jgi:hypothetical protein
MMDSHYHLISAFKNRSNMTTFGLFKLKDGKPKPFSLTHASVEKITVSVIGADTEIIIDSDGDDVVFDHSSLSIRFGALAADLGSHDLEILAYKIGNPVPYTIFGRGLKESVLIQMRG